VSYLSPWPGSTGQRILAAIDGAIVTTPGTRHWQLVKLARRLKQIPELQDRDGEDLEPIVRHWFAVSLDNIRTKDWAVSWSEWLQIWCWATPELCARSAVQDAVELAEGKPMPQIALKYPSRTLRTLVAICKAFHDLHADQGGVWYLSCRDAAAALGIDKKVANYWLNLLVKDGILEKVGEHKKGSLKAQRYRYRGDELEAAA
jgi:hypothetical protein